MVFKERGRVRPLLESGRGCKAAIRIIPGGGVVLGIVKVGGLGYIIKYVNVRCHSVF